MRGRAERCQEVFHLHVHFDLAIVNIEQDWRDLAKLLPNLIVLVTGVHGGIGK